MDKRPVKVVKPKGDPVAQAAQRLQETVAARLAALRTAKAA